MRINDVYNGFTDSLNTSSNSIIYATTTISSSSGDIAENAKELIINSAFINTVAAWEKLLEQCAIAYSMREPSLSGLLFTCYISPKDENHASELIKGDVQYLDWSTKDKVISMAMRIFENGQPFVNSLNSINTALNKIKKVRNNIAHNSEKSNKEFDDLVRSELSPGDVGITTAQFLLTTKTGQMPFWREYFDYLELGAKILTK